VAIQKIGDRLHHLRRCDRLLRDRSRSCHDRGRRLVDCGGEVMPARRASGLPPLDVDAAHRAVATLGASHKPDQGQEDKAEESEAENGCDTNTGTRVAGRLRGRSAQVGGSGLMSAVVCRARSSPDRPYKDHGRPNEQHPGHLPPARSLHGKFPLNRLGCVEFRSRPHGRDCVGRRAGPRGLESRCVRIDGRNDHLEARTENQARPACRTRWKI